jgi:hypothetical protein
MQASRIGWPFGSSVICGAMLRAHRTWLIKVVNTVVQWMYIVYFNIDVDLTCIAAKTLLGGTYCMDFYLFWKATATSNVHSLRQVCSFPDAFAPLS